MLCLEYRCRERHFTYCGTGAGTKLRILASPIPRDLAVKARSMAQSSSPSSVVEIRVGDTFGTFTELEVGLESRRTLNSHCRTIARKCGVSRHLKDDLKYYEIKYC